MTDRIFRIPCAIPLALLLLGLTLPVRSDDGKTLCVVVHEMQGQTSFALNERPAVSFVGDDVQLQCAAITVLYPLDSYLKMTIEESTPATAIRQPDAPGGHGPAFTIRDGILTATGLAGKDATLALYTTDGKLLAKALPDAGGSATLSTVQLRAGVYIITFGNKSFKIVKKP